MSPEKLRLKQVLRWIVHILLLFVCSGLRAQTDTVVTNTFSPETTQLLTNVQNVQTRFSILEEELGSLEKHIQNGEEELKAASEKMIVFLDIEQMAPEEFNPYLNQWRIMRESYDEVLADLESKMEEAQQNRIHFESRIRLWQLKTKELKGHFSRSVNPPDSTLLQRQKENEALLDAYEEAHDRSQMLIRSMAKLKTRLLSALELCRTQEQKLQEKWRPLRFSYLITRQEPRFSKEALLLASSEIEFRIKNRSQSLKVLREDLEQLQSGFIKHPLLALLACSFTAVWFVGIFFARKFSKKIKDEKKQPLLVQLLCTLAESLWEESLRLSVLFLLGMVAWVIRETQSTSLLFLLLSGLGFFVLRCLLRFLPVIERHWGQSGTLLLNQKRRLRFFFKLKACLWMSFFFLVFQLFASLFEYQSELARLFKWCFEVGLFALLFSILKPSDFLSAQQKNSSFRAFLWGSRLMILVLLILVLLLDGTGYTYLSDYLVDSSLKSLFLLPLFFLFRKAFSEWGNQQVLQYLSRTRLDPALLVSLLRTLRRWVGAASVVGLLFTWATIWDLRYELWQLLTRLWYLGLWLGSLHLHVGLVISMGLSLYFSLLLSRVLRTILERNLYPKRTWDPGIRNAMSTGLHYALVLIGLFGALHFLGFDIRHITVLAGAFGIGLGFGLQNLANNFASGIVLLIERPIKVGDLIQLGTTIGRVKKIGARSTSIETAEQAILIIPNGDLISGQVTNWTTSNFQNRICIPISVAYGSSLETVQNLLLEVAREDPDLLSEPQPWVEFKTFGNFSIDLNLICWVRDLGQKLGAQTQLMYAVEKKFRENQIEIPYPKQEVVLKS